MLKGVLVAILALLLVACSAGPAYELFVVSTYPQPNTPIPPNTPAIPTIHVRPTATEIPEGCWWIELEVVCLSTPGASERIFGTPTPGLTVTTPNLIQSNTELAERLFQLANLIELEAKTLGAVLDAAWWFIYPVQPVAPEYAHEERQCWHVRELDGKTLHIDRFETWRCEERLTPQICEGDLCLDPERKQIIWEFRFENEELGILSLRH